MTSSTMRVHCDTPAQADRYADVLADQGLNADSDGTDVVLTCPDEVLS